MEIEELFKFRKSITGESKDDYGYIINEKLISNVIPTMLESKLVDSDDYSQCYHLVDDTKVSIDGHTYNESGERLQLFVLDKNTSEENQQFTDLMISEKKHYEKKFNSVKRFVNSSIIGDMNEKLQDSDTIRVLLSILNSPEDLNQIDVVEIFLISFTATVSFKGSEPAPRSIHFDDDSITVSWTENEVKKSKEILIVKSLINLNYLYTVQDGIGNCDPLEIRFEKFTGKGIPAIQAASEAHFESYLCVLPASILVDLYKRYSTRMLEKNVRSFLDFRGVNAGIKKTIRREPEKFIAYNNGLTITATKAKISNKKGQLEIQSLTDFQIVNGGQTTATLYFSHKEGVAVDKVNVMAKVNVAKNDNEEELENLITSISRFSNAQSRVSNVDLDSRKKELIAFKKLSNSISTPTGKKYFFERAKGDYKTQLRKNGNKKHNEFPPERRFSKELLAKYYSAWGNEPYKVKKGGEKIFRHFIEKISNDGSDKPIVIDRDFYEATIAKIIMFKKMEKIYGAGKNSMGQLRSAVIPYSLSVLYQHTDHTQKKYFDMGRIWKNEGLEEDLHFFIEQLMIMMNELIKKYSLSEDYGEYSKKEQLWKSISCSNEISDFMSSDNALKILSKYTKAN